MQSVRSSIARRQEMEDGTVFEFERELAALAALRAELALKVHLASTELRGELEQLEHKWNLAQQELQRAKAHVERDAALLRRGMNVLLSDLRRGLQNAKRALESN
jgi:hypothetical protein